MSNGNAKASRRPALGRGLSSLISSPGGGETGAPAPGRRILEVPIEQVRHREDQPRRHFDESALAELVASVRDKGILLPLLVRRHHGGYELIAGERRWRAAQRAGLKEVPVVIEEADDDEAFEIALIENIQRQDLTPIEEAEAYQRLMERHDFTQEQLAHRVGKERSTVTNSLRLLKLPASVRQAVNDGRVTMGHARALVSLPEAEVERGLREVLSRGLSVRQTESLVARRKKNGATGPERGEAPRMSPEARDLIERLQRILGVKVDLRDRKGRGTLLIEYGNLEELDRVVNSILGDGRA